MWPLRQAREAQHWPFWILGVSKKGAQKGVSDTTLPLGQLLVKKNGSDRGLSGCLSKICEVLERVDQQIHNFDKISVFHNFFPDRCEKAAYMNMESEGKGKQCSN